MSLPKLAVTRPVTALVLLISVLLIGGIAVERLPLAYLPEVDAPFIVVTIPNPNSSPAQIEREITEPTEDALATLSGVKKLSSTSSADSARLVLQFDWGQQLDVVRMQVREKVDVVRPKLPPTVGTISITSFKTTDMAVVEARVSAQGVDLSANYSLLESHVLDPIRRIRGVARVDLDGVAARQVYVDLIQDRINEHRVDVGQLAALLQSASVELVLGKVADGSTRYTVRGLGTFSDIDALKSFSIGIGDLRLSDIAQISYEEPPIGYGRHLGRQYAIGLSVYKESTANTVEVVDAVMDVINTEINDDPRLSGIELFVWQNQADQIRAGIDGLRRAGMAGAAMAVLCLYVFLRRLGSTLIVALSIPFSVIATCGVMYFMGKSLNLLSMMGLMLGVGMLVDNAIVVLESIDRRHRNHPGSGGAAALEGARSVTMAVIAATTTTLIVFLPLVVGVKTELSTWLKEVGLTISIALGCSVVSSLLLIPLVAARLLSWRSSPRGREQQASSGAGSGFVDRMERTYGAFIRWTMRRKLVASLSILAVLGVGSVPMISGQLSVEPFSATINERLHISYEFTDFHYKSQAEDVVDQVEAYLYEHEEEFLVDEVYSWYTENDAATIVILTRKDLDDEAIKALRKTIRSGFPTIAGATVKFSADADSGGTSNPFSLHLYGRDGEVLRTMAAETQEVLAQVGGVEDVSSSFKHGRNEVQVSVDRGVAGRRGVTAADAADAFGFTLGGMQLPRYRDGQREADTWLALRIEDRSGLKDLQRIEFPVEQGAPVKLGEIADFDVVPSAKEIHRRNRHGSAWVSATYEGEKWEDAKKDIETRMNAMDLPLGYQWSWDEHTLEQDQQTEEMVTNFWLALVLVYLVLASLFESVTQPIAIIVSIVFAMPGAAWMLTVTDTPLNIMAQIGLLILLGIVVNNGVVFLDRVNQLRAEGIDRVEAFAQAGQDRLRPILMTASTTIFGLLPLALGGSAVGGLFYFPLARTVMGGLISSAFLTLAALPLVTVGVEGIARGARAVWRAGVWRSSK